MPIPKLNISTFLIVISCKDTQLQNITYRFTEKTDYFERQ
jgi:hypothetical protein